MTFFEQVRVTSQREYLWGFSREILVLDVRILGLQDGNVSQVYSNA